MATPPPCTVGTISFGFNRRVGFVHFILCVCDDRAVITVSSEKITCFYCSTVQWRCARAKSSLFLLCSRVSIGLFTICIAASPCWCSTLRTVLGLIWAMSWAAATLASWEALSTSSFCIILANLSPVRASTFRGPLLLGRSWMVSRLFHLVSMDCTVVFFTLVFFAIAARLNCFSRNATIRTRVFSPTCL